jgi:hypothetical protein
MTDLEKALALIVLGVTLLVTAVAIFPFLNKPPTPEVLQAWADHEVQYRKLVDEARGR